MSTLLKACNGGAAPTVDLSEGLVAHYLLNNNADDSYGNYAPSNIGTIEYQGDSAYIVGTSYVDTKHYLTVSENVDTAFTISGWYRRVGTPTTNGTSTTSAWHAIFGAGSTNSDWAFGLKIREDTNAIQCQFVTTPIASLQFNAPSGIDINDGESHHFVVTYDGSETLLGVEIYIDGVKLTLTETHIGAYEGMRHDVFMIGCIMPLSSTHRIGSNGTHSNVRVYNEVKDQEFINALYAEGYYPKPLPLPTTTNLIAHYPLTGTAEDSAGNYDGTEVRLDYTNSSDFGAVADFIDAEVADTHSYIEAPKVPTGVGDFTVSGWIRKKDNSDGWVINNKSSTNTPDTQEWQIFFHSATNANYMLGDIIDNTGAMHRVVFIGIPILANQTWYHFALRVTGNNIEAIVNGMVVDTTTFVGTRNNGSTTTVFGTVGWVTTNYSLALNSRLRECRFYDRSLTAQEITDIYNYEKNFRSIDIDDGLVAYYPLAENSLDNYYNQYDGTDTAMTYDGLSGVFNGSGYVTLGGGTTPYEDSTHTFSCWVKVSDLSAIHTIFSNSGLQLFVETDGKITLEYSLLNIETYIDDNGNEMTSDGAFVRTLPSAITVNEWTHIAYTINNNSAELFINGEKVNGLTTTQNIQWSISGVYARLGCKTDASLNPSDFYNGNIAKSRFFGNVISPDRIKAIYNSEKGDFI